MHPTPMRTPVKVETFQLAVGGAGALSIFAAIFIPVLISTATDRQRFQLATAIWLVAGGVSLGLLTRWRVRREPDTYPLQEGLTRLGLMMLVGFVGVVCGEYILAQ